MLPAIMRAATACKKLETEGPRLTGLPPTPAEGEVKRRAHEAGRWVSLHVVLTG